MTPAAAGRFAESHLRHVALAAACTGLLLAGARPAEAALHAAAARRWRPACSWRARSCARRVPPCWPAGWSLAGAVAGEVRLTAIDAPGRTLRPGRHGQGPRPPARAAAEPGRSAPASRRACSTAARAARGVLLRLPRGRRPPARAGPGTRGPDGGLRPAAEAIGRRLRRPGVAAPARCRGGAERVRAAAHGAPPRWHGGPGRPGPRAGAGGDRPRAAAAGGGAGPGHGAGPGRADRRGHPRRVPRVGARARPGGQRPERDAAGCPGSPAAGGGRAWATAPGWRARSC